MFTLEKKSYKCSLCPQIFSQSGHLNRHMQTHTGGKPHKCAVCAKLDTRREKLKKHMKVHTGEKSNKWSIPIRKTVYVHTYGRHTC